MKDGGVRNDGVRMDDGVRQSRHQEQTVCRRPLKVWAGLSAGAGAAPGKSASLTGLGGLYLRGFPPL